MNWIILIIAGLCETGFAFCLGKVKLAVGAEWWAWISGFAVLYVLSAVLLAKATQTIPIGTAYPVDGHRCRRGSAVGHLRFPRASHLLAGVFPQHAGAFDCRVENRGMTTE